MWLRWWVVHASGYACGPKPYPRDVVDAIQAARLTDAMVQVVAELGYAAATVPRVTGRAGMSRLTFYQLFNNREDCFLVAFERTLDRVGGLVSEAYEAQGSWLTGVRAGLAAALGFFEAEPMLARFCVVDALGVSERVLARRAETLTAVAKIIAGGCKQARGARLLSPLLAEGLVGAVLLSHPRSTDREAGRSAAGGPAGRADEPDRAALPRPGGGSQRARPGA